MNKHGGSNRACIRENFLKKNKKNSMLIRDFRVLFSSRTILIDFFELAKLVITVFFVFGIKC